MYRKSHNSGTFFMWITFIWWVKIGSLSLYSQTNKQLQYEKNHDGRNYPNCIGFGIRTDKKDFTRFNKYQGLQVTIFKR